MNRFNSLDPLPPDVIRDVPRRTRRARDAGPRRPPAARRRRDPGGRRASRLLHLQVRPDRLAEYRERHAAARPEMLLALRDEGRAPLVLDLDAQLSSLGSPPPAQHPTAPNGDQP